MPLPLFAATLWDLSAFLEAWPQIMSDKNFVSDEQTKTLLYWLSWGTHGLNTPHALIPVADAAMRELVPQGFDDHGSVMFFAEDLGGAVSTLMAPLPPLLEYWVESGRWHTWMDELHKRWHAAGQTESAGQQAIIRMMLNADWMIPRAWVEFAFTNDGQGATHGLTFKKVSGDVEVTWSPPPEADDATQYWLPETGSLCLPEAQFLQEVEVFRAQLHCQMTERLLALTALGELPFSQAALGKHFLRDSLGPLRASAPVSADAVLLHVRRLEAHFGVRVEDCFPDLSSVPSVSPPSSP